MNTRRCELCGKLHGGRSGSVTISVPKEGADYCSHDHYNLCETCALRVYDDVEKLKVNENQPDEKQSALIDLVQGQNATILKLKRCLRGAYDDFVRASKFCDASNVPENIKRGIDSAIEWLDKSEMYYTED